MRCKVGDLVEVNKNSIKKNDDVSEIMYLDTSNLTEGIFYEVKGYDFKKDKVPSRARRRVQKEDILLSTVRPNQKHYGFIEEEQENYIVSTGFAVLTPNYEVVDAYYLYKYLTLDRITEQLQVIAENSTSAYPSIKPRDIEALEIDILNLNVQKRISTFLKNIDDKIELNNSIISNLEEIAQTLFKRWFVDFEFPNEDGKPYKSSGGKMVEGELGMIPERWEVGTLNDIGKIVGGGTPSKKVKEYYAEDGYSWLTPKDLSTDKSIYQYKGAIDITEEGLGKGSAKLHPENTILFSSRAPIGYIAIAGKAVATNQGFKSIIPTERFSSEYIYLLLKHITPIIESNASGSTFKEISGKGMKNIKTILPTLSTLDKFHQTISKLFNVIQIKEKESKYLTELRDTLLPKLLSGEIELPDDTEVTGDVPIPRG